MPRAKKDKVWSSDPPKKKQSDRSTASKTNNKTQEQAKSQSSRRSTRIQEKNLGPKPDEVRSLEEQLPKTDTSKPPQKSKARKPKNSSKGLDKIGSAEKKPSSKSSPPREIEKKKQAKPKRNLDKQQQEKTDCDKVTKPENRNEDLPGPLTVSQPLSEKALQDHTRGLESIEAARRLNGVYTAPNNFSQEPNSEEEVSDTGLDPWTAFTRKWGYLPPLDEEASKFLDYVIENPHLARDMARVKPESPLFAKGLDNRNVSVLPRTDDDPKADHIKRLSAEDVQERDSDRDCYDSLWDLDQAQCRANSNEAMFQRTVMINLIARHFLIYQQDPKKLRTFEFSFEQLWTCRPMPSKSVVGIASPNGLDQKFLTAPKPDLTLCFNRDVVIPLDTWTSLPEATQSLACAENMDSSQLLVFPFLTIEAKSAYFGIEDPKARNQSLNNASQALFNLFEFFRDAGSTHEKKFYKHVRFFSVVAVRGGMLVRVHRAVDISKNDRRKNRLLFPGNSRYPLDFEHRVYAQITSIESFTREAVLKIIKPILKYAKDELSEHINSAAEALADRLKEKPSEIIPRRDLNFYHYGQPPAPKTGSGSKPASAAQSPTGGQKGQAQSAKSAKNGRSNLSQIDYPPSARNKKRNPYEMEIDGDDEDLSNRDTQDSSQSKRRKTDSQD